MNPYHVDKKEYRVKSVMSPTEAMLHAGRSEGAVAWEYKAKVFDLSNPKENIEYTSIMDRIYNGDSSIEVVEKKGSFGPESNYIWVLEWKESKILPKGGSDD